MAVNARIFVGRAAGLVNSTLNYTSSTSQLATENSAANNATLNLISNLVFAESKSVRTSTIILAAFNVLASFTTAASILYDCYWASKRCNPKFKASKFCVSSIHPAETFPLVLAIGIVIQGLVFAGVQGEGLTSLFTSNCKVIAQFMWPALFIVPYIQFVFGLECAIRSFRATPFQARGKWDVTICLATIVVMLIVTWIPSHIYPEHKCFASLVWFITKYGFLGFIILSTAAALMIISAITIFTRLSYVPLVEPHQRIAASRMVYYLVLGIVSLAFIIPYFSTLIANNGMDGDLKLAMMATVVLNLSGLMNGLLQLFLRSNTATTAFGPKIGRGWERTKHDIRIFGPNELAMHAQLMNPVTGPQSPVDSERWTHSRSSLVKKEKSRALSMESLTGAPLTSAKSFEMELSEMPSTPKAVVDSSSPRGHTRKLSYSIFPSPKKETPVSVYDISDLAPPPSIHFPGGVRHKRDSSVASSATVQIGLRLSHAPTPSQEDIDNLPLPSTTYNAKSNSNTLALPSTIYKAANPPTSTFSTKAAAPLSPLRLQTSFATAPASPTRSASRPAPVIPSDTKSPEQSPTRTSPSVNKTLPPTPKFSFPAIERLRDSNTQLSPAVYSPEKKFPAPGLGALGGGPRSATLPQQSNPLRANPLDRTNSGRIVVPSSTKPNQEAKRDWI